ncbi:MAG: magnesium transporter [Geminicoccaceae bacterium]|nr:magnesium transporter [Geminicoccaceae bacterium]
MSVQDERAARGITEIDAALIRSAHPADAAARLEGLPAARSWRYLAALPAARRARIFAHLPASTQAALARFIPPPALAGIMSHMDADDRADLFNLLSPDEQRRLMHHLAAEDRDDISRLEAYAEETAAAIMTSDYATLGSAMTAREAIPELRRTAPDKETIYRSCILDEDGRLVGSVRLHTLVLADDETPIAHLMEPAPVSVTTATDREEVARLIARYDIPAIAVVDEKGRLCGIVTHDDATDAMQAETTGDFQKISTVLPFAQTVREAGIGVLYARRIVWLALLVFGNLFSGAGIAYFEEIILACVSLVFFLPLLIDSSGNAGSQSATLMVRALAVGDVTLADWRSLILRELAVAAPLGATMAVVVFPLGAARGGLDVALAAGTTMFLVVAVGSLVGMSLPFLLSRLKLDPATASGPLVTTISDAVGVLVHFSIASLFLAL